MSSGDERAWTLDSQEVECRTNLRLAVLRICKFVGQKTLIDLHWDPVRIAKFMCKNPERVRLARPAEVVALAYLVGLNPEEAFRICVGLSDANDMELKFPGSPRLLRIHENRNWEGRPDRAQLVTALMEQAKEKYEGASRKLLARRLGIDSGRLVVLAKGRCAPFQWVDARIGYFAGLPLHEFWELEHVLSDQSYLQAFSEAHRNYMKWCADVARKAEIEAAGEGNCLLWEDEEELVPQKQEDVDTYLIQDVPEALDIRDALLTFGAGVNFILRENQEIMRLHVHPPKLPGRPVFEGSLALLDRNFVEKGRSVRVHVANLGQLIPAMEKRVGASMGHLRVVGIRCVAKDLVAAEPVQIQQQAVGQEWIFGGE